jgi:regulator of extracellular matrix RemA (YlzA/DUF370 family)
VATLLLKVLVEMTYSLESTANIVADEPAVLLSNVQFSNIDSRLFVLKKPTEAFLPA